MTTLTETPRVHFEASAFAPRPAEWRGLARDEVRLLVASAGGVTHARFRDLADHLEPGDVLVVNTSATLAGEIDATLAGRPVVVHIANRLDEQHRVVELRTAPDAARAVLDAHVGDEVALGPDGHPKLRLVAPWPDGPSSPTGHGNRLWRAAVIDGLSDGLGEGLSGLDDLLAQAGRPIAYGYLDQRFPLSAYQTVFATTPGSAEMASAARPFSPELVTRLVSRGIVFAPVTLHTGVSSQEAGEAPGPEWFEVPAASARLITSARRAGSRIIAVGTTATRAVESSVADGGVHARRGWTTRVVTPNDPPAIITGLITGWHDPQASHLLLVEAVAGRELTQAAYSAASASGYLWHEFGDSALLLP